MLDLAALLPDAGHRAVRARDPDRAAGGRDARDALDRDPADPATVGRGEHVDGVLVIPPGQPDPPGGRGEADGVAGVDVVGHPVRRAVDAPDDRVPLGRRRVRPDALVVGSEVLGSVADRDPCNHLSAGRVDADDPVRPEVGDPQRARGEHAVDRVAADADHLDHARLGALLGRRERAQGPHDRDEQRGERDHSGQDRPPAAAARADRRDVVLRVGADDLAPQLGDEVTHACPPILRRRVPSPRETRWRTAASDVCVDGATSA